MKCTRPMLISRKTDGGDRHGYHQVPCGKCMACRLEKSRQWAVRITHESRLYKDNCFMNAETSRFKIVGAKDPHIKQSSL